MEITRIDRRTSSFPSAVCVNDNDASGDSDGSPSRLPIRMAIEITFDLSATSFHRVATLCLHHDLIPAAC